MLSTLDLTNNEDLLLQFSRITTHPFTAVEAKLPNSLASFNGSFEFVFKAKGGIGYDIERKLSIFSEFNASSVLLSCAPIFAKIWAELI